MTNLTRGIQKARKHPFWETLIHMVCTSLYDMNTCEDMGDEDRYRWAMAYLADMIEAVERDHGDILADAARWRKLMRCERIRVMGWSEKSQHIGMEFWAKHEAAHPSEEFPQEKCRERFASYVDGLPGAGGLI